MAKKKTNKPEIDNKTRKALTETKVNINDGWADDVPIVYNTDKWMPEDADLTMVKIDALEGRHHRRVKHTALDKAESPDNPKPVVPVKKTSAKPVLKDESDSKPIPAIPVAASKKKADITNTEKTPDTKDSVKEPRSKESLKENVLKETLSKEKSTKQISAKKDIAKEQEALAGQLTTSLELISLEDEAKKLEEKAKKEKKKKLAKEIKPEEIEKFLEAEGRVQKKNKIHPFRMFMIIWLGILAITISVLLGRFYNFLENYEAVYQASRPYHNMDELLTHFYNLDVNELYNLMTVKPVTNEFETEENVKHYMQTLLEDKMFTYYETQASSKELPEYFVAADGYVVAKVALRKVVGETLEYSFPKWYISSFELYSDAQYSVRIEIPSNYSISINGISVSDEYAYETGIEIDDEKYFQNYITDFPTLEKYYCTGFYEEPSLYATNIFGTQADIVWNMDRGIYEVPFSLPDDYEEIAEYATQVVTDYAFFISQDAGDDALDKYFPEGEELLKMIKASTSRQFFTHHSETHMENIQLNDFIMYTPDCVYVGITMDQHLKIWSGDEVVPINGNFCYVKIDGEWKVCAIKY